ncbi:hypothetical protein FIBSPDRAFT_945621 [Athelia psychrophila]|uniref:Uncharacterized protein n=1 Tax=Athelia psychrophila TaxID=1759441 RepID=A0A166TJM7_9AGAM|nr:hypothetical protein FIBSPDRAFT_945621 [Fibularhizoctonia sp. CBS 109695]
MDGSDTLQSARTIVLLNSIVLGIITFALGRDYEHTELPEDISDASGDEHGDEEGGDENRTIRGQVYLMSGAAPHAITSKASRVLGVERAKNSQPGKALGRGVGKTWEAVKAWMSPALGGGVVALILGIIPPFHTASFSPKGVFTNMITKAADNLGGLLWMFILGATLAITPSSLKAKLTLWVLPVRYVFTPAISISATWGTGRGWYDSDRLMLLLISVPSGTSALLLLSVAQQAHADEGPGRGLPHRGVPLDIRYFPPIVSQTRMVLAATDADAMKLPWGEIATIYDTFERPPRVLMCIPSIVFHI